MNKFSPSNFFDLSTYAHVKLFDDAKYVWEILSKIKSYIENFKELGTIKVDVPEGAFLIDKHLIFIDEGTIIEPGSYIKGPCIIGKNCFIRHGAYIRGNFIAGDKCVIGHATEVKNSIMLDGAQAGHFAYLGDAILGNRVNLGAGTKCANLKLDHKNISVILDGQRVDTGLKKLGAILGDESQLGCNSVTNPGTFFEKNVYCYPCVNVGGFVETKHVIKCDSNVLITKNIQCHL